jgi:hypothetical protein
MADSTFVKQARTVITLPELTAAVLHVWPEAEDEDVSILFGKLVAECGWPNEKQACWNNNVGNIRGVSKRGFYTILGRAYEIVDADRVPSGWYVVPNTFGASVPAGKVCVLPVNPSAQQQFRAYESIIEAIEEYLEVLGRNFVNAWKELRLEHSDPIKFVYNLKAAGYMSGDVKAYATNTKAGYDAAMKLVPQVREELSYTPMTFPDPTVPRAEELVTKVADDDKV